MGRSHWRAVWERALRLGAPATGEKAAGQVIRTTDVFITAALSPAAVVALGISSLYVSLPGRIGGGFITASRTLVSQDTGAGADANRDQAMSQAVLLAILVAVPFVLAGLLYGPSILRLIGTDAEATRLGNLYLVLVLPTVPLGIATSVGASALQATGNTKTPMYFTVPADVLNAVGSLVFGLGLYGAPELGVGGVGGATLVSKFLLFVAIVAYVQLRSPVSFVRPRDRTIARQLVKIGSPRSVANSVTGVAMFPFNTLLLQFGTVVNAGYQIAWRVHTQVISPLRQGLGIATATIVGQQLGEEDASGTWTSTRALLVLGLGVGLAVGGVIVLLARPLAHAFASDGDVATHAERFIALFGAIAVLGMINGVAQAVLSAGSETRIPLISRVVGMFGGMIGISWLLARGLGWGVTAAYAGQAAMYVLMLAVTMSGLVYADWIGRATSMMVDRGSAEG